MPVVTFKEKLIVRGHPGERMDDLDAQYYLRRFRQVLIAAGFIRSEQLTEPLPDDQGRAFVIPCPFSRAISTILARDHPSPDDYRADDVDSGGR